VWRRGQGSCVWLAKAGEKVYAKVIPNVKGSTLTAILDTRVVPGAIVFTETLISYNVLDVSSFKQYRMRCSTLFSDQKSHINGVENFWNQAKRHMRRFNDVPKAHFHLFLKECEWRFNIPQPKHQQVQLMQWAITHFKGLSRYPGEPPSAVK